MGSFVAAVIDLTEKKQAEQELQSLLEAVAAEKERLSLVLGSINDEVWFVDRQGRFTLANPAALRVFGYSDVQGVEVTLTPAVPSLGTRGACRVLVADDNRDAADSLAMLLELSGHEVRVAHDGRTALSLAQVFRPDISLLDIGMPNLSGYEVAQALRRETWGAQIRLIALTGWGQEDDRRRAQEAGFDHHLTKPVAPETLEALLANSGG